MLLALLRHGETIWSRDKRLQGRTDVPLSESARRRLAGLRLPASCAGLPVVSSPLARCTQTGMALGLGPLTLEPRIAEMSWGQWEGRRLPELRAELGWEMQANEARGFDFLPPQGESPRQVRERITPWLAQLASAGRPTLALSHRGVIRVVFAVATGWDMLGRPPAKMDWDALQLFDLDGSGHPSVRQLNVALEAPGRGAGEGG